MWEVKKLEKIKYLLLVLIAIMVFGLSSCKTLINPPSIESVEKQFLKNYDDIVLVTEDIISSGFESVYMHHSSNTLSADGKHIDVLDENLINAIQNLFNNGYSVIMKSGNTIYFQQWTRFTDAGCGIAYSIDGSNNLDIQYLTQATALSCDGWYYYVADYSAYRTRGRF